MLHVYMYALDKEIKYQSKIYESHFDWLNKFRLIKQIRNNEKWYVNLIPGSCESDKRWRHIAQPMLT